MADSKQSEGNLNAFFDHLGIHEDILEEAGSIHPLILYQVTAKSGKYHHFLLRTRPIDRTVKIRDPEDAHRGRWRHADDAAQVGTWQGGNQTSRCGYVFLRILVHNVAGWLQDATGKKLLTSGESGLCYPYLAHLDRVGRREK
eukprot:1264031-Amorphochlora_amoeboformis.AAC.1